MVESGLNIRADSRSLSQMALLATRQKTVRDIEHHNRKAIYLSSIEDLFILITICYFVQIIILIFEKVFFNFHTIKNR